MQESDQKPADSTFKPRARDAKLASKQAKVLELYYDQELKPREISRALRMPVDKVSYVLQRFKQDLKRLEQKAVRIAEQGPQVAERNNQSVQLKQAIDELGEDRRRGTRASKTTNPRLLDAISKYLDGHGIQSATAGKLLLYLREHLPEDEVPSQISLNKVLRNVFKLKYGR